MIVLYRWTDVNFNCFFTCTGGQKLIVIVFLPVQVDKR